MIVFIDANKYLQFFSPSGEELSSLKLLRKYLKRQKITLLFPRITQDEFFRNLGNVRLAYVSTIKQLKVNAPKYAGIVRDPKRKARISKHIESIEKELLLLEEDYNKKSTSVIEGDMKYLMLNAVTPELDNEIFERAKRRRLIGNPPGKSDSVLHIGDEIVWETILRDFNNDDVVIVSADRDWADPLVDTDGKAQISDFLKREWGAKSSHDITLETSLGKFINDHFVIEEKVTKEEIEKEENILTSSDNLLNVTGGWGTAWGTSTWSGTPLTAVSGQPMSPSAWLKANNNLSDGTDPWACVKCHALNGGIRLTCISCGMIKPNFD